MYLWCWEQVPLKHLEDSCKNMLQWIPHFIAVLRSTYINTRILPHWCLHVINTKIKHNNSQYAQYVSTFQASTICYSFTTLQTLHLLAAARQLPKRRKPLIEMIATFVATWPANFCCWVLALASWMDCWVYQALCISPKEEHVGLSFWYWIWYSSLYMAAGAGFKPSTAWVMNGDEWCWIMKGVDVG